MRESRVLAEIRLAITGAGWVAWRNNTGLAPARDGSRPVRYGLAVGSADLVGCAEGRFLAVEAKSTTARKRAKANQAAWGAIVRAHGGIYVVARSGEEAVALVREQLGQANSQHRAQRTVAGASHSSESQTSASHPRRGNGRSR